MQDDKECCKESALEEAFTEVVEEAGIFTPEEAHYLEASPEEMTAKNIKCSSCQFYSDNACELVTGSISPEGYCRLWVEQWEDDSKENYSQTLIRDEELAYISLLLQDEEEINPDSFNLLLENFAREVELDTALSYTVSLSFRKEHKDPEGGLTDKGRAYFNKKGSNLKPGVDHTPKTAEEIRRQGSFLTRFYGQKKIPPLKKPNGKPTRFALASAAWNSPVPQTNADVRKLYAKGKALLARYEKMKEAEKNKKKSKKENLSTIEHLSEAAYQFLSNGLVKIPVAKKGRYTHQRYGKVEFTDRDFEDIVRNFEEDVLGFKPYVTYGHLVDPEMSVDAELKKGTPTSFEIEEDVLYAITEPTSDTFKLIERGEYEYSSGEFIRNYMDKETGENRGTVLMRYALTNSPFIPFKDKKIEVLESFSETVEESPHSVTNFMLKLTAVSGNSENQISLSDSTQPSLKESMTEELKQEEVLETPVVESEEQPSEEKVEQIESAQVETPETQPVVEEPSMEEVKETPTVEAAPVAQAPVTFDLSKIVEQVGSQFKEVYAAQIEAVKAQAASTIEALKAEIGELKTSLIAQQSTVQAFSTSMSNAQKTARYQAIAAQGVPASLILRFSQIEAAMATGSQVIKLSTAAGEKDENLQDAISQLLIDAVNVEPVKVEQFGQSVSKVAASAFGADMQAIIDRNLEAAKKLSL